MAGERGTGPGTHLRSRRWLAAGATAGGTLLFVLLLASAAPRPYAVPRLFQTADGCMACHNNLRTKEGEDVSIGTSWRASMMANSARDPYWQASVRREVLEHPAAQEEIEDTCSTCHAPMARAQARAEGTPGKVFANLPVGRSGAAHAPFAADGVSCTLCHQILDQQLGRRESFNGGFVIDQTVDWGRRPIFGPYVIDSGRSRIMQSASDFVPVQGEHTRKSELCATCHTLYTEALDSAGNVVGQFPEQVPYLEWKNSAYSAKGAEQSCQSCHMPVVAETTLIAGVLGTRRERLARHNFRGGNFFMLEMLNRYRADLGVEALPSELETAARETRRQLQSTVARVAILPPRQAAGRVSFDVEVTNLTGHKFPTAYPSRRAWLHLSVSDAAGRVVFESGKVQESGAIAGNDNDRDASAFEPHHREIRDAEQVQVYESVLQDWRGRVTTGLLFAASYAKDNRLLPGGFDKEGAHGDIAVRGEAALDPDFDAGVDRVRYSLAVDAAARPLTVRAELRFQPIGYRWAQNLTRHDAPETRRFVKYYDSMSHLSSTLIATDSLTVR